MQIAAGSADKDIRLWDTATGKGVALFKGHKDDVECLDFSVVSKQDEAETRGLPAFD